MPLLTMRRSGTTRESAPAAGANQSSLRAASARLLGGGTRSAAARKVASLHVDAMPDRERPRAMRLGAGGVRLSRPTSEAGSFSSSEATPVRSRSRIGDSFSRLSLRRKPAKTASVADIRERRSDTSLDDAVPAPMSMPAAFFLREESAPQAAAAPAAAPPPASPPAQAGGGERQVSSRRVASIRRRRPRSRVQAQLQAQVQAPAPGQKGGVRCEVVSDEAPVVRAPSVYELCEHRGAWQGGVRCWMDDGSGNFVVADGERRHALRYEAFRQRFGFCVAYWTIARPGAVLDGATAARWGLVGARPMRMTRVIVQLFLAGPHDDSDLTPGRYYASFEVSGAARWQPVSLHCLTANNLKLLIAWARRVPDAERAPRLRPGDTMVATLDAIDAFCVAHPSVVVGPRT